MPIFDPHIFDPAVFADEAFGEQFFDRDIFDHNLFDTGPAAVTSAVASAIGIGLRVRSETTSVLAVSELTGIGSYANAKRGAAFALAVSEALAESGVVRTSAAFTNAVALSTAYGGAVRHPTASLEAVATIQSVWRLAAKIGAGNTISAAEALGNATRLRGGSGIFNGVAFTASNAHVRGKGYGAAAGAATVDGYGERFRLSSAITKGVAAIYATFTIYSSGTGTLRAVSNATATGGARAATALVGTALWNLTGALGRTSTAQWMLSPASAGLTGEAVWDILSSSAVGISHEAQWNLHILVAASSASRWSIARGGTETPDAYEWTLVELNGCNLNDHVNTFLMPKAVLPRRIVEFDEVRSYAGDIRQIDVRPATLQCTIPVMVRGSSAEDLERRISVITANCLTGGELFWQDGSNDMSLGALYVYQVQVSSAPEIVRNNLFRKRNTAIFDVILNIAPWW